MATMPEHLSSGEPVCGSPIAQSLKQASVSVGSAVGDAVGATRAFASRMRDRALEAGRRAEAIRQEKPLHVLAVLGGLALAAGFATRLWRISSHA